MESITILEVQKAINDALNSLGKEKGISNENRASSNGDRKEYEHNPRLENGCDSPIIMNTTSVSSPGNELKTGEDCNVDISEIDYLERIIADGGNNLLPVHFLEEGAINQRAVARVAIPGVGFGTGFLVSKSLFITNNHVIGSLAEAKKAKFEFNYQQDKDGNNQSIDTYSADPDSVFYTNAALDFTLVKLKRKSTFAFPRSMQFMTELSGRPSIPGIGTQIPGLRTQIPGFDWNRFYYYAGSKWGFLQLINSTYSVDQHVNVIQHPRSRRKEVSLQDNNIKNVFPNHIRYTTDTEPGSSGSPVFNNAWDLIALHHSAGERSNGVWVSNQGVRIDKIVSNIRAHYLGSNIGQQILNELGI